MQTSILNVLCENKESKESSEFSFVIDKNQANNVIGNAGVTLEANGFMVKHVTIIAFTAQVVIVRHSYEEPIYGWCNFDSAIMLSAIKRAYKGDKLVFDGTLQPV